MQYIKMSYKGFSFDANPSSLTARYSKNVSKKRIPFSASASQEVGPSEAVISGEGSFVGAGAMKRAHELLRIYNKKGSDYLFCPHALPIKAYFSELDISYSSAENKVSYCFTFVQDSSEKASDYSFKYTIANAGENLFDVANRTGVDIEKIVASNDYEDLFSISEGDKVWLA